MSNGNPVEITTMVNGSCVVSGIYEDLKYTIPVDMVIKGFRYPTKKELKRINKYLEMNHE